MQNLLIRFLLRPASYAVVMTSSLRPPTTEHVVEKRADIRRDLESVHDICVVVLIV